jgi:hypothetical protein
LPARLCAGNKQAVVVDKSMAFKWVPKWQAVLDSRSALPAKLTSRQWLQMTPEQQLASALTDQLLAE